MCYVVNDFDASMKEAIESPAYEKLYEMPDGRKITLGAERFRCPEALFEPSVAHYEMVGV
jgi:actin beta/gamma 1